MNPKIREFELLKQSAAKVSLSEIPSIGFIDVVYVEKYFNLFLKSYSDNHSFKNKFLSPLSVAQVGAGLNPKDGFPSFCSPLKAVYLHFLPTLRHYVVSKNVGPADENVVLIYDSNHQREHFMEMMNELKPQLEALYGCIPPLQISCPQTSLPYSNHALFALATFQVLALGGDPFHVKFNPGKMREKMPPTKLPRPNL